MLSFTDKGKKGKIIGGKYGKSKQITIIRLDSR